MANNISGTTASDTLNGLSGDNVISGGAGNDKLNGGAGVDTLDGGTGSDTISGNSGDDTLVFDATAGGGPSLDLYDGGSGKDTLKLLLSYSQWSSGSFQTELANYLQFIDVHTQWRTQEADNSEYTLSSFGGGLSLRGSKIEFVKVIVDGVDIGNPVDEGVTAVADSITVSEDGPPGSVNVLANDSIPDLTGSVTFGPLGQPSKGTVSEVFPHIYSGLGSPSHILQYTPTPGAWDYLGVGIASATETFTYTVTDVDGDSQTATVTVTIVGANDAPVAVADTGSATEAGTAPGAGAGGNVLTNDTDVDTGDSKIVSAVNGAAGNVGQALDGAYGALTLNGDGTYSYVVDNANPTVDALRLPTDTLTDSFTYKVKDAAGAESQATLTITIHGANDAPVAVADTGSATEAGTAPGAGAGGNVLTNDTDVDTGDSKIVSAVNGAAGNVGQALDGAYGALTLNGDGTYSYVVDNANPTVDALRLPTDILTDSFTYKVKDAAGAESQATLTITIHGANDAPVAVADTGSATEAGTAPGAGAGGNVLTNDTDVDTGDSKIVSAVNGAAGNVGQALDGAYGALTLNGDGTYSYVVDNANPTVDALRLPTDILTDSFTYKVKDAAGAESQATLTITIHGANDAPVFVSGQTGTVAENAPAATVVYDADVTDVDGLAAVFSITGTDAELFSIDPATGEVRFNASPDFESPGDSDGDNIYDITVNAFDGLATTSRNVAIDVTNANEAPSITSNGGGDTASASVAENTTAVTSVTAADPDVPTALTYSIVPGGDGAKFTIDGSTGALSFLTAPNFEAPGDSDANNSYVVTVRASDGSLHDDQTITVAVTDVAEGSPPVAHPENVIISTGTVGQIPISALLANDTDPDLQTVSFNGIVSAVGGTVTDLGKGLLSVGSGVTSFTYTVKDTTNAVSNAATVTVLRQAVGGGNTNDNIDISAQTYVASYIDAASGNDSVTGGGGVDNFIGGSGADRLVGGNGPDTMLGASGNDVLTGGLGDDVLDGGSNNNTLTGGGGNDTLTGSPGNGANNADVFVFTSINDGADVITNFAEGSDKIDLSAIDANGALAGDPLFGFNPLQTSATQNFGVTWEQSGSGNTIIRVDTDGQPGAELIITLLGLHTLQSTDFVL